MSSITADEYAGWIEYFNRRPPGWRADNRAALIANAMGAKTDPDKLFHSLQVIKNESIASREASLGVDLFNKLTTSRTVSGGVSWNPEIEL